MVDFRYVYFIKIKNSKKCKIGITNDIDRRFRKINSTVKKKAHLMVAYKLFFARWHEKKLHLKYSEESYYYRGAEGPTEWFKLNFLERGSVASYLFLAYLFQYLVVALILLSIIIFFKWI